ncbi:unnamed protein product, partial [Amoebophrya sp. A25]|eukprot:GSA25T00028044001.1
MNGMPGNGGNRNDMPLFNDEDMMMLDFDDLNPEDMEKMMEADLGTEELQAMGFQMPEGGVPDGAEFELSPEGMMLMMMPDGTEIELEPPAGPSEMALPVASFPTDTVAQMFRYLNPTAMSQFPMGQNEDPYTKFTVFTDAESRPRNDTSTGFKHKCVYGQEFYVKLGPGTKTISGGSSEAHNGTEFVKLNKVDGVSWSCIAG